MLKARIITALVLLSILLPILFSHSFVLFSIVAIVFFGTAIWESQRLFMSKYPIAGACIWSVAFIDILYMNHTAQNQKVGYLPYLFLASAVIWLIRFTPLLATGLPVIKMQETQQVQSTQPTQQKALSDHLLHAVYSFTILIAFLALVVLFQHSAVYLLSVMALVWIADIGAYFSGKAYGKRKLAPSISPGKSWEGALGGWAMVLFVAILSAIASQSIPALQDTFVVKVLFHWGWLRLMLVLTLIVAASVVGDLFESQLKRRANMKDSSHLLPGHGGVLDRIDALIPVLPLAALLDSFLR